MGKLVWPAAVFLSWRVCARRSAEGARHGRTDLLQLHGLATVGFGDITPVLIQSRFLTILEMVTGVMYIAILIARLTGVYPVVERKS